MLGTAAKPSGGPESFGDEGKGCRDVLMRCLATLKDEVSEEVDSAGHMEARRVQRVEELGGSLPPHLPLAGRSPSACLGGGFSCYLCGATQTSHTYLSPPPCQVCCSCMYLARLQCWPEGAGWRNAARTILLTLGGCAAMNLLYTANGPSWALIL